MDSQSFSNSGNRDKIDKPLVLAVDDNEDNLQLLMQLLELIECTFITATNGQTALAKAEKYQPDLILLDMMLPDLSGIDITYSLKQNPQTQAIPIIAVTAMARAEDREQFLLAGCVDHVTKPYMIEHLVATINRYISSKNSF